MTSRHPSRRGELPKTLSRCWGSVGRASRAGTSLVPAGRLRGDPSITRARGGFGIHSRSQWETLRLTSPHASPFPAHFIFSKKRPRKVTERIPRPQSPMQTAQPLFLRWPLRGPAPSPAQQARSAKMLPLCSQLWERRFLGSEHPAPFINTREKTGLQPNLALMQV